MTRESLALALLKAVPLSPRSRKVLERAELAYYRGESLEFLKQVRVARQVRQVALNPSWVPFTARQLLVASQAHGPAHFAERRLARVAYEHLHRSLLACHSFDAPEPPFPESAARWGDCLLWRMAWSDSIQHAMLSDAMLDAGYDDDRLGSHLREPVHCADCYAVNLIRFCL